MWWKKTTKNIHIYTYIFYMENICFMYVYVHGWLDDEHFIHFMLCIWKDQQSEFLTSLVDYSKYIEQLVFLIKMFYVNSADPDHLTKLCRASSALCWIGIITLIIGSLTLTMLWANSTDDKMIFFFLFFIENRIWHFMKIFFLCFHRK